MAKILDVDINAIRVTGSLANGAAITALTNSVAGQNSGTQATSANRAVIVLGEQNGKAAAQFDGVNDCYDFGNILSGKTEGTIYFLAKWALDPPTNPTKTGIWQNAADAASVVPYSNGIAYEGWGTTARRTLGNLTTDFSTAYRLYTVVSKTNDYRVYLDKDQVYPSTPGGANTVAFPTPFIIGKGAGDVDYYFNGKVLRILAFDTAHTAAEFNSQRAQLAVEYNLDNISDAPSKKINFSFTNTGRVTIGDSISDPYGNDSSLLHSTQATTGFDLTTAPNAAPLAAYGYNIYKAAPFSYPISGILPNRIYKNRVHFITPLSGYKQTVSHNGAVKATLDYTAASQLDVKEFLTFSDGSANMPLLFTPLPGGLNGIAGMNYFEFELAAHITDTTTVIGDSREDDESENNPPRYLAQLLGANYFDSLDSTRTYLVDNSPIKIVTLAKSGNTLQEMLESQLSEVDSYLEGVKKIVLIDAGGNDIAQNGKTAAQTFAYLQSLTAAYEAKGIIVYVATICNAGTVTDAIRAVVTDHNNLIRANYPANRIIDYALVPELNDYANTTYFQGDQLHYTDLAKQLKALKAFNVLYPPTSVIETLNFPTTGAELFIYPDAQSPVDNANAASLTDYSGKTRHLTGAATYPTFQTGEVNGKDIVRWDGTSKPLNNSAVFTVACGWLVVKINETTNFSNEAGILSDLGDLPILGGDTGTPLFYDFPFNQLAMFEFRSNDRIYKYDSNIAPINTYKIIFFRYWKPIVVNGIQIGQDRNFTDRKAKMDLAFLALYSTGFCESDIRKHSESLAGNFALTLADVFPFQGDKDSNYGENRAANIYDPPEGDRMAEVLDDAKQEFDLKFTTRRQSEVLSFRDYWRNHYPNVPFIYRSFQFVPPEDTEGYFDSGYSSSGSVNNLSYSFKFKQK